MHRIWTVCEAVRAASPERNPAFAARCSAGVRESTARVGAAAHRLDLHACASKRRSPLRRVGAGSDTLATPKTTADGQVARPSRRKAPPPEWRLGIARISNSLPGARARPDGPPDPSSALYPARA